MAARKIGCVFALILFRLCLAAKEVNILTTGGLAPPLKEDDILRILAQNKTESRNNYTLVEFIESLGGRSYGSEHWSLRIKDKTNPYYDDFSEEIDREASKLLHVMPPFNPAAGDVSKECKRHAQIFQTELRKFTLWALKMYDATAKISSGLLNGNVNQLGDFDECVNTEGSDDIKGQYCLAYLQLDVDQSRPYLKHLHRLLHSHYAFRSNVSDPGHRVPRFSTINWAVCTPASCTSHDVELSIRHTLAKYTVHTGLKIDVQVDEEMCQTRQTEPLPYRTKIVGFLFISIAVLSIIAGFCDHCNVPIGEIFLAFSLKRNILRLVSLDRTKDDIATVHGVRALNAILLIVAHKSMALFFNPYTNRTEMSECLGKPWTVIGRAASLYTDPFIMLSGLLTTYSFVGRLKKTGRIDIINEYISRLLRLVPTLGALILFCTHVMPYIGSGPQWNLVVTHHANICKETWWRNFLFIHNYFGFENMCLTHTHHLGIDTQLFFLSPILIVFLYRKPKLGTIVLSGIALFSTVLRFYVTYIHRLNNYVFFGTSIRQLFDTANLSYILPTHRLTVYIMGIFVGYILRRWPKDYKINNVTLYSGWLLSSIMWIAAFFGPAGMGSIDYVYNPLHAATYNAFAPIGWCALFAWITFLSHTENTHGWLSQFLSWRGFLITTRLSYAIYLTQFPVFFYNVGQTRSSENYSFLRMVLNFKELLWIILTSAVLTLLFDTPFQNIKYHFFKKSRLQRTSAKDCKND